MPHEKNQSLEQLFFAWSNGEALSPLELEKLMASAEYQEKVHLIEMLKQQNEQIEQNFDVPKWDRGSTFVARPDKTSNWWQESGMSMLAISFSLIVCVMFVFDLKVQWHEGSVQILTAQQQKMQWQKEQQAYLQDQVVLWNAQNQQQITNAIQQLEENQTQRTVKLANYLIDSSRTERKEDLQRFVTAIQEQRAADLRYFQSELGELQYKFQMAALNSSSYNPNNNSASITAED